MLADKRFKNGGLTSSTTVFFVTIYYLDILNQTLYNSKNGKNYISFEEYPFHNFLP